MVQARRSLSEAIIGYLYGGSEQPTMVKTVKSYSYGVSFNHSR